MNDPIKTLAVIGGGTMGHGIAEVLALSGRSVRIRDVDQRFLDDARRKIEWSVSRLHEKGRLKEDTELVTGRISYHLNLSSAVKDCDMVIEAVPEDLELKKRIFADLSRTTEPSTVLATNTSCLPIGEIASAVREPSRVVGTHFFNPPVIMKLIEVIRGSSTSDETVKRTLALMGALGKTAILVRRDVPGFVVNRVLARMMATARVIVQSGMATITEVDASLKYGANLPMGPFELLDYIGLDTHNFVENALAERGFAMPAGDLISSKVRAGTLGAKTGSGFYVYSKESPKAVIPRELAGRVPASLVLSPSVNEAVWLVSHDVASAGDIDLSTALGLGFPKGILTMADEWGLDVVLENLESLKKSTGEKWLEPEPALLDKVERGEIGAKSGSGFFQYSRG
ncbi:MAG TPA: 3-hydroxyacyl-CoA dehydrogenase [Nitrososphaerales archaeon]|nr:3-hydroxyacyl-CoA dehydrogenase [Nitrososphaerales archaeon]